MAIEPAKISEFTVYRTKLSVAPVPPAATASSKVVSPSTRAKLIHVGLLGTSWPESRMSSVAGVNAVRIIQKNGNIVAIIRTMRNAQATALPGVIMRPAPRARKRSTVREAYVVGGGVFAAATTARSGLVMRGPIGWPA